MGGRCRVGFASGAGARPNAAFRHSSVSDVGGRKEGRAEGRCGMGFVAALLGIMSGGGVERKGWG